MGNFAKKIHSIHETAGVELDLRVSEVMSGVDSVGSELFFDTEKLVVLGQTLRAARSSSLDLSGSESDHKIRDEGVLSFSRSVRDHDSPSVGTRELGSLDRFSNRSDLVDLENRN